MRFAKAASPSSSAAAPDGGGARRSTAARRFGWNVARLAASLLLSLLAVEMTARLAGLRPKDELAANPNEPILHAPDPTLGWTTIPGSYVIPPYAYGGTEARITIRPDHSRATAASGRAGW